MSTSSGQRPRTLLPPKSLLALAAAVATLVVITVLTYRSMGQREGAVVADRQRTTARNLVNTLLIDVEQAQAGGRGYLLTQDNSYLRGPERATSSFPGLARQLRSLLGHDAVLLGQLEALLLVVHNRIAIVDELIALDRSGQHARAIEDVKAGRGRAVMDEVRETGDALLSAIEASIAEARTGWGDAVAWSSFVTFGGTGLLLGMLLLLGTMASRDFRSVGTEAWMRRLKSDLAARLQADYRVESLGAKLLDSLVEGTGAQVGIVYVAEAGGLRPIATHALSGDPRPLIKAGEGLAGQVLVSGRLVHLPAVPAGYMTVGSGVGTAASRHLVIAPAVVDGTVQAIVELGYFRDVDALDIEAIARVSELIGTAMRAAQDRGQLENLLEETQRQAEELQAQGEELRVTNEELEQQRQTLQRSQALLENQQSELEEVNAQLEEQASSLERQRDELARTGAELQRTNEFKSQFLANMSHELRTPLNSSLILAKLLADNRDGNLTDEQTRFAQAIHTAGNDLLVLINDILDLSKIEAGMLDVRSERVPLARIVDDLRATFGPLVEQKALAFEADIDAALPATMDTDPARLQQILRNLMSNAVKFTERGGVVLDIERSGEHVAFAVRDTGIGIPLEHQASIFEAFRQADGATNRKFGGTGLGLTISRDLARMLGGDLRVDSAPGRGSTFTLTLPLGAPAAARGSRVMLAPPPVTPGRPRAPHGAPPPAGGLPPAPFVDDRARVTGASRTLLIIEDDVAFARVVFDLAHELEFLAVATTSGDDGLRLARELAPSAIILDVGLPDRSGLAVLEALKRDPRTRHVPVHVISAHDYTHTALGLGAAGYALKPIERERLVEAVRGLEARITHTPRRVLIVEDDPALRASTAALLRSDGVELVGVGTAGEALALLASTTFDCMVLDLSLPGRSGLELLEEMAKGEQYSFPPVIVYTGRALSKDEVHQLERFSSTIIIKGARSPERLLDEVTLFLHQVEARLPPERQRMLKAARDREAAFDGKSVLVVEDDVRNVFALAAVLEPRGAKVAIARNGREALAYLAAHDDVDLVLMDIMMPEMDGIEAMQALRAEPRFARLPIIALTAKAMADDREKCLAAGASDYIAKPLDVDKLLSLARVWIRK